MNSKTESARDDILHAFLQADLVVLAPERLDVHDLARRAVELLDRPEARHLDLAHEFAARYAPLLLRVEESGVLLGRRDDAGRVREGEGQGKVRVEERVEQSARMLIGYVQIILAVREQDGDVDVTDDSEGIKLDVNKPFDEFCVGCQLVQGKKRKAYALRPMAKL